MLPEPGRRFKSVRSLFSLPFCDTMSSPFDKKTDASPDDDADNRPRYCELHGSHIANFKDPISEGRLRLIGLDKTVAIYFVHLNSSKRKDLFPHIV